MNYFDKCKQCTIMVGNGTGVLFQPKEEVNYSYILTAKHTKEEVNYSYILTAKHNLENEDNIEFNFKKIYRHEYLDIAIIKIEKREFISPNIKVNEPKDKEIYKLYGYSTKRREEQIKIQAFDLEVRDIHKNHEIIVFNRDYDAEQCDIDGLSGGGEFQEDGKDFLVAGIECRMDKELDEEENNTRLRFISIKAFDEIVENYSEELVYIDSNKGFNYKYSVEENIIQLGNNKSLTIKTVPIEVDGKVLNVSIYPVTCKEYDLFCESEINSIYTDEEKSQYPIVDISWNKVEAYCLWLGKKIEKEVRLLNSWEWDYVVIHNIFKKENSKEYITYSNSNLMKIDYAKEDKFGLKNIVGNIYEWCWDGNEDKKYIKGLSFSDSLQDINKLQDYTKMIRKSTQKFELGFRIVF